MSDKKPAAKKDPWYLGGLGTLHTLCSLFEEINLFFKSINRSRDVHTSTRYHQGAIADPAASQVRLCG